MFEKKVRVPENNQFLGVVVDNQNINVNSPFPTWYPPPRTWLLK